MSTLKKPTLKEIPDIELEAELLRRYREDLTAQDLTPEQTDLLFKDLGRVENFDNFLRTVIAADRLRYFNAAADQQFYVKGATMRTIWLLKSIQKVRTKS